MDTAALIYLLTGLTVVIVSFSLGYLVASWRKRFDDLQKRVTSIEQQIPKRHTHNVAAGIEDAIACAIDVYMNQRADGARLETLMAILQTIREGPYAYDPERKAGLRK